LNDYKGSLEDCSKAIELEPINGYAYLNRGIAKEMLRDDAGACADWHKAAELGAETAKNYSGSCK
jgi:Flp pilus assembly protein TadD